MVPLQLSKLHKIIIDKMKEKSIIVIGSTNMDMVVKTSRLPTPDETIIGKSFIMNPGGKGANQGIN